MSNKKMDATIEDSDENLELKDDKIIFSAARVGISNEQIQQMLERVNLIEDIKDR